MGQVKEGCVCVGVEVVVLVVGLAGFGGRIGKDLFLASGRRESREGGGI